MYEVELVTLPAPIDNIEMIDGQAKVMVSDRSAYFIKQTAVTEHACIHYGQLKYYTHDERVAIIRNDAEADYDTVPDGVLAFRKRMVGTFICAHEIGLTLIREWDGTLHAVELLSLDTIQYSDGLVHRIHPDTIMRMMKAVSADVVPLVSESDSAYW